MNDDLLEKAKRKASELGERLRPQVRSAAQETQAQAHDALRELGGLLVRGAREMKRAADSAARSIHNDINKRD